MRQTKVSFVVAFAEKVSLTSLAGVMPSGLDCLVNAGSFVSLFFLGWKIDRELLFPYRPSFKTDRLVSCTTSIVAILFNVLSFAVSLSEKLCKGRAFFDSMQVFRTILTLI